MKTIPKSAFEFLKELKRNNHRDWMQEHKKRYQANEKELKTFYTEIVERLNEHDEIEKTKVFRINRDVRFSKDKTPYNVHRSVSFSRAGAPGGFFSPEPKDLLRIRKEFEMDDQEMRTILNNPEFKKAFGGFNTDYQVKTAPKGFSKDHPSIDLIKNKSFFVSHSFTDKEVFANDFLDKLIVHFELLRPYFDYMSDVLTTDLNGVSLINE